MIYNSLNVSVGPHDLVFVFFSYVEIMCFPSFAIFRLLGMLPSRSPAVHWEFFTAYKFAAGSFPSLTSWSLTYRLHILNAAISVLNKEGWSLIISSCISLKQQSNLKCAPQLKWPKYSQFMNKQLLISTPHHTKELLSGGVDNYC